MILRSCGVSLFALVTADIASAQTVEPEQTSTAQKDAAEEENLPELVVTGSRITRRDYVSATPVVTTDAKALRETGAVNVEKALNQMPQFVPGSGSQSGGGTAAASAGRATLNLRGLGDRRNLVLLDGRRLPPASVFNVIDVNMIPLGLIQNVETITGGASAVYGSDAISGVVNFITRKDLDGLELNAQVGNSEQGDRFTTDLSLVGGTFAVDRRLHMIGNVTYTKRDELRGADRSFFDLGLLSSFIGYGTFVPAATNLPSQTAVNTAFPNQAPGAVGRTNSLGFNDNGSLFSQNGAIGFAGAVPDAYTTFGNVFRQRNAQEQTLERPLERYSGFGRVQFDFSDDMNAYAQALYNHTETETSIARSLTQFITASVSANNPFIPASLRAILNSRPNPTADFTINSRFVQVPNRIYDGVYDTTQFLGGLRGDLGFRDWTFDIYGSTDRNKIDTDITAGVLGDRVNALLRAADGGASLCAGGYNPFGLANAMSTSAACIDYMSDRILQSEDIRQNAVEGSVQGPLFNVPAGEVQLSLVATYRENKYEFNPDPQLVAGNVFAFSQTNPTSGRTDVREIAGELLVPLLRDVRFFHVLNLNLGARYSDYNISGGVGTHKVELEWAPVAPLLIRGGYQRAVRAPNIGELFSAPTGGQVQIGNPPSQGDPCDARTSSRQGPNGAQLRDLCVATGVPGAVADTYQFTTTGIAITTSGNLGLTPEEADTVTAGVVFRPRFSSPLLSGLSASVDYYDIDIKDVISTVAGNTALSKCYNLDGSNPGYSASNQFCQLISRDATGGVSNIGLPYLNLGGLKTTGVDVQFEWKLDLTELGIGRDVSLALNSLVSYLDSYEIKDFADSLPRELADTIDANNALPLPKWRYTTATTVSFGKVDIGLRWQHLNAMRDITSVIAPTSAAPGVPSYDLFDLIGRIGIGDSYDVRLGVTNLFDEDPLVIAGIPGNTLPGTYDIVGRSYYVGLNVRF